MDKCKLITNEFRQKTFGHLFAFPVDPKKDMLDDYEKIVTKPMDFSTITNNLNNNVYQSTAEWYNDMSLVFQNAIDYYKEDDCISLIAKYCLSQFKKASLGLNISSDSEWIKSVQEMTQKLTNCYLNPPFHNYSQKVIDIKNNLDSIPNPGDEEIYMNLEKLNSFGKNDDTKYDLYGIFKEIGRMPPESLNHPIDLEKLPSNVVKSLIQYVKDK